VRRAGSGKTGAFALPVLQALLKTQGKKGVFCLVLSPTRELCFQIRDTFDALGAKFGLKTSVIVGGIDMVTQAIGLQRKPHVIVATPGRIIDHLENTKGFNMKSLKYLIMDEADRILNLDFEEEVNKLLAEIPRERTTFLFSATMTSKVQKLQRACLRKPIRVEVSSKFQVAKTLLQRYVFVPQKHKDCYLTYILNQLEGNSFMVFCNQCHQTMRVALLLRDLGFNAISLHGKLTQPKRLGALSKFTSKQSNILIATDVASRGLDIPHVDVVLNFDVPQHSKDYIHRVGRTARAGRSGRAITFVTQYDVEPYQRIEQLLKTKLDLHKCEESKVMQFVERVTEAQRNAIVELKSMHAADENKKKKRVGSNSGQGGGRSKPKKGRH